MKKRCTALFTTGLLLAACATAQSAELNGKWRLTEIADKSVPHTRSSISFLDKDQTFSATAGCNSFFGYYRTDNKTLLLSNPAVTMKGCPEDLAALEAMLANALNNVASYQIQQNQLKIYNSRGQLVLKAER